MAVVDVKGIHRVTAKGRTYVYAWRGGPRLESEPGTPAFFDELALAHARAREGDRSKISGLCIMFRASSDWKGLADKTRTEWARWLDRIQIHFGDYSIRQFSRPRVIRPRIRAWRAKYAATPRAADMGLQVLSRLLTFAVENDKLDANPCGGLGKLYKSNRAGLIWTPGDLAELKKHAAPELYRVAELAALTGLRKSDVLRLSWSHVGKHALEIRTGKTGKTAVVPLYDDLRAFLAGIKRQSTRVLLNTEGRPWGSGFNSSWNRAVKAAKINLHFHDLRGTAATRFFLASLSLREIAEILAWSEDQVERIINTYVRKDAILLERIERMNGAGTESVKLPVKPAPPETASDARKAL